MIDTDLAALYDTETKRLKQQVKRNGNRFPPDFMFELNKDEKEQLIELSPRLSGLKHSSVSPMVFTEQGVAMLSSVLSSDQAVQMNIGIMRAFSQYRAMLLENNQLRTEIMEIDDKLTQAFQYLLDRIDALAPEIQDREPIGFKSNKR